MGIGHREGQDDRRKNLFKFLLRRFARVVNLLSVLVFSRDTMRIYRQPSFDEIQSNLTPSRVNIHNSCD